MLLIAKYDNVEVRFVKKASLRIVNIIGINHTDVHEDIQMPAKQYEYDCYTYVLPHA